MDPAELPASGKAKLGLAWLRRRANRVLRGQDFDCNDGPGREALGDECRPQIASWALYRRYSRRLEFLGTIDRSLAVKCQIHGKSSEQSPRSSSQRGGDFAGLG